jgi:hypothetical protein
LHIEFFAVGFGLSIRFSWPTQEVQLMPSIFAALKPCAPATALCVTLPFITLMSLTSEGCFWQADDHELPPRYQSGRPSQLRPTCSGSVASTCRFKIAFVAAGALASRAEAVYENKM